MASPSADDEYLTTDEVAARLRVHPTTILRRLGAMAGGKTIRACRCVLIATGHRCLITGNVSPAAADG